jgi:hypothetical protein
MEKIVRYIFVAICLSGCLLQIYKISEIYFLYQTTTDVRYDKETNISLPALTICIFKLQFIKPEYSSQLFPNKTVNKLEIFNKLSIKKQFEALIPPEDIPKNFCFVVKTINLNDSSFKVECDVISPVRRTIDYLSYCFTYFSQLKGEKDDNYLIDYDLTTISRHIISLYIPKNITTIDLYIHSRNEIVRYQDDLNYLQIDKQEDFFR